MSFPSLQQPDVNFNDYKDYLKDYELKPTPLTIKIGDYYIQKVKELTLLNAMDQFLDTLDLTFDNPRNTILKVAKLNDPVTVTYQKDQFNSSEVIFEGVMEKISGESRDIGLKVGARHKALLFAEDEVEPRQFKVATDNDIISYCFSGWSGKFFFDPPVTLKEEEAGPQTRKAAYAEEIANKTGHHLYIIGDTVYKKKVEKEGSAGYKLYESYDAKVNNVLGISIDLDVSNVKKNLKVFHQSVNSRKQRTVNSTAEADQEIKLFKYNISRTLTASMEVPAKDEGEAHAAAQKGKAAIEPQEYIEVTVKGWINFPTNAVVYASSEYYDFAGDFVVIRRSFSLDASGLMTTTIRCIPKGRDFYS